MESTGKPDGTYFLHNGSIFHHTEVLRIEIKISSRSYTLVPHCGARAHSNTFRERLWVSVRSSVEHAEGHRFNPMHLQLKRSGSR